MSEANNLVRRVGFTVRRANVIPTPLDPTLSHEGEAADAAATGAAIAGVFNNLSLNGKSGSVIVLYAGDIALSNELGAPTIAEAISGISDKDASEIMYDAEHLVTIADAIDEINEDIESEINL